MAKSIEEQVSTIQRVLYGNTDYPNRTIMRKGDLLVAVRKDRPDVVEEIAVVDDEPNNIPVIDGDDIEDTEAEETETVVDEEETKEIPKGDGEIYDEDAFVESEE